MKTIRSIATLAGLFAAVLTLGAAVGRGQVIHSDLFAGTFTLPAQARWGNLNLPAGVYSVRYGIGVRGSHFVEVVSKEKESPYRFVLAGSIQDTSATRNAIVCIRDGNTLVVRTLEMPAIGESANFAMPRGGTLVAQNGKHNGYKQLAQAPMLIQRIPITY